MGRKRNRKSFIKDATEIHGGTYDYSLVNEVKSKAYVCIICSYHGKFILREDVHLAGWGCNKCKKEENRRLHTNKFLRDAKSLHGEKYDYSKVEYISSHKKIEIVCGLHGSFLQTPSNHLAGKGCKLCGYENSCWVNRSLFYESNEPSWLYIMSLKNKNEDFIKVGISNRVKYRRNIIQKQGGYDTSIMFLIEAPAKKIRWLENEVLRGDENFIRYIPKNKFQGHTECFALSEFDKIVNFISEIKECDNEFS